MKLDELRQLSIDEIFREMWIEGMNIHTDNNGDLEYIMFTMKPCKNGIKLGTQYTNEDFHNTGGH